MIYDYIACYFSCWLCCVDFILLFVSFSLLLARLLISYPTMQSHKFRGSNFFIYRYFTLYVYVLIGDTILKNFTNETYLKQNLGNLQIILPLEKLSVILYAVIYIVSPMVSVQRPPLDIAHNLHQCEHTCACNSLFGVVCCCCCLSLPYIKREQPWYTLLVFCQLSVAGTPYNTVI